MGSRDKDTKSLQDKLKVFFKKGASAPLPARNELAVTPELERELGPETPVNRRLRLLREVGEKAKEIRVQEGGVKKLWKCTRDLLEDPNPDTRHTALWFMRCLAEGQADDLLIMRTIFFRYLRETHCVHPPEDAQLRFRLLHTLTETGKNIKCFEEQIGSFLLEWLPGITNPVQILEFLQLIINVVKYNAAYLDEEIIHGIVNNACHLCVYSADTSVVQMCLSLLEAVVSYSLLPRAALRTFVCALCRTVNLEYYCQNSWKLMRCVVGADIGHAALQEMVDILHNSAGGVSGGEAEAGLVRGAVFYINMALWGPRRVPTLKVSYLAVLPAFLKALSVRQAVVTYEVVVAVQSLMVRVPQELHEPAWDVLINIVRAIIDHDKSIEPPNELIHTRLHALITSMEQLHEAGQYYGDATALLDLLDYCGHDRPESSTMRVITQRAASLGPASADWMCAAAALADKYVRREPRLTVRLHALDTLHTLVKRYMLVYADEVLERVGVPVLSACALDADASVRAAAARLAADLAARTDSEVCTDLVDLLEKILNRPFEMYLTEVAIPAEADASDLRLAAAGLLDVFQRKLLRAPAAHATRCFLVLLDHLDQHYKRPTLFMHHPEIRIMIFEMIFGLRANTFNCVGFCHDNLNIAGNSGNTGGAVAGSGVGNGPTRQKLICSPFLFTEPPAVRGQQHQPLRDLPPGACVLQAGRASHLVTSALTRETDWVVLGGILRALPGLLQARALAVGRRAQDLDMLASTLCSMICDRSLNFPECVRVAGAQRLTGSEFRGTALPALAALAPYHAYLEPQTQQRIVRCLLKHGMVLRTPQPYINALTIFTLETRDTMVKMLPEVLLDLSKISDTKNIASPMLEFLSTLTRLPRVFASFVEDQYMSVFAILLPYTNPSRYNHYVVSLAHHVIAAWFLKCRLSYRRNFVRFIIHGLHNYIIMPFEEQLHNYKPNTFQQATANEDSSNRKRSSSLGSKGVSRVSLGSRGTGAGTSGASGASSSAAFHVELTETCVDLLARYTFTPCSVKPRRSDTAEFIFNGGHATTWLVGHKLITITTSGCLQNTIKQGLCDRCAVLCRQHAESVASPLPPLQPVPPLTTENNDQPTQPATVQVQVSDGDSQTAASSSSHLHPQLQTQHSNPPEVKRYSKHSLQHSRSTDTWSSSLSISDALAPAGSAHATRQNSSENNRSNDPVMEALNQFSQRFERLSKEVDTEESGWSRVGRVVATGACPCWCAHWAEVHVRSPTGDVSWVMRMQNQMNWDYLLESPLQDVMALLTPAHAPSSAPPSSASSGIGDSRHDVASEGEPRSRSGSASSQSRPPQAHPQDLHKSSSDSVVAGEKKPPHAASHCIVPPQPHRMSTQPINIPGSPQRQSSSSTTDEDDMLLIVPEGKSRHPVRRSNSSPEMSSSWKLAAAGTSSESGVGKADEPDPADDLILLPSCEPTSTSMSLHATKKAMKKSDMRVSCEAIPEEMSGTSPLALHPHPNTHPHPHLMTYNSDPGTSGSETGVEAVPSDTTQPAQHQLQKMASDSAVPEHRASKPPAAPRVAPAVSVASSARDRDDLPPLSRSKRSNTISVMSPTRRHRDSVSPRGNSSSAGGGNVGGAGGGVTPSFVLLQLYHNMSTYPITPPVPGETQGILNPLAGRPLKVSGEQHERTIKNLDLVPPVETYKVGVLYVGPGQQDNEVAILKNEYGSVRYAEFLSQLGTVVSLEGADADEQPNLFLNLEKGGKDGLYTYVWHDDIMQVLFHVATAMPSSPRDPNCNEKRKYIGNDYVSIVYNDSGADFHINTIKGQVNVCIVVVEPLEHGMSRVCIRSKDERIRTVFMPHAEPHVLSDHNVPLLARQVALHCALASQISQSLKLSAGGGQPFASNSLERLRTIKRLRRRLEDERIAAAARAPKPYADRHDLARRVAMDDFNDYT